MPKSKVLNSATTQLVDFHKNLEEVANPLIKFINQYPNIITMTWEDEQGYLLHIDLPLLEQRLGTLSRAVE